jgi:hypothetical protein
MTQGEWDELRWRTLAKGFKMSLRLARKTFATRPMPKEFENANPEEISRGWGKNWVLRAHTLESMKGGADEN